MVQAKTMFREDKATQMAAAFLKLKGGQIKYIHLLKMMYMADKAMLLKRGSPITYDKWASLKWGPILSATYDLIKRNYTSSSGYWYSYIDTNGNDVVLGTDPGDGTLSVAEDRIIQQVFDTVGNENRWDVVYLTHTFPEWTNPGSSALPIKYEDVLEKNGKAEMRDAMLQALATQNAMRSVAR